MTTTVNIGDQAPDFTLPTDGNGTVSLSGCKGKKVVVYFYPKDDTPGCTVEAQDFRDFFPQFQAENTVIIGISKDNVQCHNNFKSKYSLPFILAADEERAAIEAYDCWKERSMYGKKFMGIERATFLVDEQGILRNIWRKVKVDGHAQEVLKTVQAL